MKEKPMKTTIGYDDRTENVFVDPWSKKTSAPDFEISVEDIVKCAAYLFMNAKGIDLSEDADAMFWIEQKSEEAKTALSQGDTYLMDIPHIIVTDEGPKHLQVKINKNFFKEENKEYWLANYEKLKQQARIQEQEKQRRQEELKRQQAEAQKIENDKKIAEAVKEEQKEKNKILLIGIIVIIVAILYFTGKAAEEGLI